MILSHERRLLPPDISVFMLLRMGELIPNLLDCPVLRSVEGVLLLVTVEEVLLRLDCAERLEAMAPQDLVRVRRMKNNSSIRENQTCTELRYTISRHLSPPISRWGKTADSHRSSGRNSRTSHREKGDKGDTKWQPRFGVRLVLPENPASLKFKRKPLYETCTDLYAS